MTHPAIVEVEKRLCEAIVRRYRAGESMEQIGKSYGIGWKKVRWVLNGEGVRIRPGYTYRVAE